MTEQKIEGLYFKLYQPQTSVNNLFIIYHGGGVNSDAGYNILAHQIVCNHTAAVCLVDIRGHGQSIGDRGDAPYPEKIWQDVDVLIKKMRTDFPKSHIHLLGHSSGGGMLINYFTRYISKEKVNSLILLAPEFGPFAPKKIRKSLSIDFASVKQWPFILNALSKGLFFGHHLAIKLNFPDDIVKLKPDFVKQYSVNMANALTPRNPKQQLGMLPITTTLLFAEKDELFNTEAMMAFCEEFANQNTFCQMINDTTHLNCIFDASDAINQHLIRMSYIQKLAKI
ncbi:alpha/beta hydrolase [Acinetobacter qingfengensis]|uniref:alpha/beta hydrolase n=1 Tax=Acinetobacter qingfengensis TaxID=1262585 RepID=UPI001969EC0D|nr:alpha/beta fold hydrolase [Acinetobacter qingfengensis]